MSTNQVGKKSNPRTISWVILLALALTWGSSFILMKRALFAADGSTIFSSQQVAALRIAIAALSLSPLAIKHIKGLWDKRARFLLFSGLIGNTIPAFLFTHAQTQISSALAGMLNATVPMFTFLLGIGLFKVAFQRSHLLGLSIALIGAVGLLYFRGDGSIELNSAALWIVLATVCYASSINVIKTYLHGYNALAISSLSLALVGPWAAAYAWHIDAFEVVTTHTHGWSGFGYVLILSVVGTALALVFFNKLIQQESALFASTVTYLMPIVAIVWGLLDGENVTLIQLGCIATILLGVWSLNKKKKTPEAVR